MDFKSIWEVFLLFLIPIGGGIPAGVVLARTRGIEWPTMEVLYFLSDVVLALLFEPFMILVARSSKKYAFMAKIAEAFKKSMKKQTARYGLKPKPLSLVMIAFGIDPMTGRTAALAAGHGFISGWALAIVGDMLFFTVLMASTLWLNNILGDGTLTAVVIMVAMIVVPSLFGKIRDLVRPKQPV